jgi:hypothetical protein
MKEEHTPAGAGVERTFVRSTIYGSSLDSNRDTAGLGRRQIPISAQVAGASFWLLPVAVSERLAHATPTELEI